MSTTPTNPSQPPDFSRLIASTIQIRYGQVQAVIRLIEEGNTIPFIARYRKEMTGELDENQIREIAARHEFEKNLYQRKSDVMRLLEEHGVFTHPALKATLTQAIAAARTLTALDDIYRPYRPKRKTRASVARERGLAPLSEWLQTPEAQHQSETEVRSYVTRFIATLAASHTTEPEQDAASHTSVDEALQGAADIFAEEVADEAQTRQWVRARTIQKGLIQSKATNPESESVYETYYDFREPVAKVAHHRILAMNRGERDGFLKVSIEAEQEDILSHLRRTHLPKASHAHRCEGRLPSAYPKSFVTSVLDAAIADAYKRLIAPAIERDVRSELTEKAEAHAIAIFGENLKNLLMQPPIADKVVLGVDPAYRTGCKLAVIDPTGKLLGVTVIYPTPPQNRVQEAQRTVIELLQQHGIELVAIGNGTASRETESFIADTLRIYNHQWDCQVPYVIVSEAGASVYSASPLAGEEFPNLDVSERSAISIARRVQDPLAELVKIDPKSVGVGQYQYDVSQQKLGNELSAVVETTVNAVGVDVNTASPSLLSYVAGLNNTVAKNIVTYREENGRFTHRKQLAKVPRLGKKTIEQCLGFLRIRDGEEVLDNTPIHPESYSVVDRLMKQSGVDKDGIRNPAKRQAWLSEMRKQSIETLAEENGVGVPTLRDILDALERPGRDPREDVPAPLLRTSVLTLDHLAIGTELVGTVRNVVDFGAFVDVGLKSDGLVHVSQLADKFVKHPMDVVAIGDIVKVRVIQVDAQKGRLGLSMKGF